jgi:hypothetical protein
MTEASVESTSTWLAWREAVDRVARYLGYPTENARLRIVRMAKNRPVRAHGRTAEGWSVGWSVSPASVAGYAIDLDSDALGPPHFSGEVINDVKLCIDDMIAADLLPAPGRPEGPVERAWWPAVEAAAYIIKGAPIEWEDWGPGMHREAARSEIKLSEAIREGLPARGRKKPGDPMEPIPASDLRPDMVETNLPVNLLYPPEVVVRIDGTVGISPPHRGNYIGPPWHSIEVDSAGTRQAFSKPLIAREPAAPEEAPPAGPPPGGTHRAAAEPPSKREEAAEVESTQWQRARTIEAIKTLLPPDGVPPKGTSIRALTERINELPEFKDNRVGEDTVERALEDLEALCVQPPSVREVSSAFASVREVWRGLARLNVPSANTRKR